MTQRWNRASGSGFGVLLVALLLAGSTGCSRELDTRCQLEVDSRHRATLVEAITKSDLWQTYLDAQTGSGKLVQFSLTMDREQFATIGGDYDCGEVTVGFEIEHLETGTMLFEKESEVDLESFMIGLFDRDATREEMQDVAFEATEEKITPYLNRWVEVAAIRAMAEDGRDVFIPVLSEVVADKWSGRDMQMAAKLALAEIRG